MTARRIIISLLVIVILAPVLLVVLFVSQFDPNRYAPALIAAVQSSTGRKLTLGGPIKLALSFTPEIEIEGISLANPPGYTDANLLSLDRIEAHIALLPLLSHQIDIVKLLLVNPKITLEKNHAGMGNWNFTPPGIASAPAATPASAPVTSPAPDGYKIALQAVQIENGLLVVKNAQGAQTAALAIASLTGTADSASSPLNLAAQASYNTVPFTLNGTVGPVERFSGAGTGPWPVNLTLGITGAAATVQGSLSDPAAAKGYTLNINANIPALEALAPLVPASLLNGAALPPLHGITAAATIVDQGSPLPAINHLSLKAAGSDLSSFRTGLSLIGLDIEMPSLSQPLTFNASGAISAMPLSVSGSIDAPDRLLNPAWLPAQNATAQGNFPVAAQAQAGDAKFSLAGGIATPSSYAGVALAFNATIPDLSQLGPLAGTPLPAWRNITVQTTVIDPGGLGLAKAVGLDGLILNMDNAALGGDASLYFSTQPRLVLALKGQQINLDNLLAAIPASPSPTLAAPPPPATPPPGSPLLISSSTLPLQALNSGNADIQFSADSLIFNNATYSAIQGHAVLANGMLTINPLTALFPGGDVSGTATLDAGKQPAAASVTFNAPALALSPFLKAFKLPATAQGTIQAALNANGTGDSPHDLLASVNGQLGLALVNGVVDGAVLDSLFGAAFRTINVPADLAGAQGPVAVRCFALRIDASHGIGAIRALTLDSSRLLVQGGGSLNFANETLGVVIRPQLRIAGNNIAVPVQVGGTFANPTTSLATLSTVQAAAKTALGLPASLTQQVTGSNNLFGDVINALGLGSTGDVCPAALSLARLGNSGPAAAAAAATPGIAPAVISGPKSLLNSLFSK